MHPASNCTSAAAHLFRVAAPDPMKQGVRVAGVTLVQASVRPGAIVGRGQLSITGGMAVCICDCGDTPVKLQRHCSVTNKRAAV
jgi:hypothetical protein